MNVREPRIAVAPPTRIFGPALRVRLAILALFFGVTGATAGVAIGFTHPRPAPDSVVTAPPQSRDEDPAAATAAAAEDLTARQQALAVRQYGVLALAADTHSPARIADAAKALQVTLTPLVAKAHVDPVALDAVRQMLTGERTILAVHASSGDRQLTDLLAQTDGLLAQLPVTPVVIPATTTPTAIAVSPPPLAGPTAPITTSVPIPSTTPTQAAPSTTPTATPTSTDAPTTAHNDAVGNDAVGGNALLAPVGSAAAPAEPGS